LTLTHVNRLVGAHPLLKVLTDAELHADRMRAAVRAEERAGWRIPRVQPGKAGPLTELSPATELRSIQGGKP
jgi:hypothetical protein